ncbi:MAG: hypothetical protein AMXMBFR7_36490 [Planctomycetota bacterium]
MKLKRCVVDASVVLKLFFDEDLSGEADRAMRHIAEPLAPDLLWTEALNVVWKRARRGDLEHPAAAALANQLLTLPLQTHAAVELLPDALDLALSLDRTVYDSLYLALAVRSQTPFLTADRMLVNALQNSALKKHVLWLGALKA